MDKIASFNRTSAGPILEVRDVTRTFGGFTAVELVSLEVFPGEILGIAGPNGAGKSTLFNLVSGVPFGPSSGEVFFDGRRIDHLSPAAIARRGLRRTFQSEQLFGTLSVEDNVSVSAAYLHKKGTKRRVIRNQVDQALDTVGIADYRSAVASEVPLLVKKKLMIATALVAGPRLLMLDEPAGGLDSDDQLDLIDLLKRLQHDGLSLLIIEHVLSLLSELAGRMIIMSTGEVLASGTPAEVLSNPTVIEAYLGKARA